MQPALGSSPASSTDGPVSGTRPLDGAAFAALAAFVHALELHDPAIAHRAAQRAAVINHVAVSLGLDDAELATCLGAALVADVSALVTHVAPATDSGVASAVLGASLLERVAGLDAIADAVRAQHERWDATGAPRGLAGGAIPRAARVLAVANALLDPAPSAGSPLSRVGIVRAQSGAGLDPHMVTTITATLTTTPPPVPNRGVVDALERLRGLAVGAAEASPIEALTSIGAAMQASQRVDDALGLIAGRLRRALGASTVTIGRLNPAGGEILVVAGAGDLESVGAAGTALALDIFPESSAMRSDAPHVYVREALEPHSPSALYLDRFGTQSEVALPLEIDGRRWGAVWARTVPGVADLGSQDLAIVRLAVTQIVSSVSWASRVAELEALALRDPLTGLGNRRVLENTLRRIFTRPPIARQDCAVIICDVDGLKIVNDTEGHNAGDAVLTDAAMALRHAVSDLPGATVCRIGGDEFCVVLDGGGMLLGEPVAARAQKLFARSGPNRSMSCGVGVASIGVNAPGELLRAADEAQYLQKRSRRVGSVEEELLEATGGSGSGRRRRRDR